MYMRYTQGQNEGYLHYVVQSVYGVSIDKGKGFSLSMM